MRFSAWSLVAPLAPFDALARASLESAGDDDARVVIPGVRLTPVRLERARRHAIERAVVERELARDVERELASDVAIRARV